jgi:hypothetical protein
MRSRWADLGEGVGLFKLKLDEDEREIESSDG